MRKIKLNVRVKDKAPSDIKTKSRKMMFSSTAKDSIKTQTITNNYYSVQNEDSINYIDLSDSLRRDARRYSYSLEVQL